MTMLQLQFVNEVVSLGVVLDSTLSVPRQYKRQLGWLRNDSRWDYFALLLMYRIVRMKQPPSLLPLFKLFQSDRTTRNPRTLTPKKYPRIRSRADAHICGTQFHRIPVTCHLTRTLKEKFASICSLCLDGLLAIT